AITRRRNAKTAAFQQPAPRSPDGSSSEADWLMDLDEDCGNESGSSSWSDADNP
ncbi:hypothetical protein IWQ60_011097, partial [Tieghemiomyces parasiticus]